MFHCFGGGATFFLYEVKLIIEIYANLIYINVLYTVYAKIMICLYILFEGFTNDGDKPKKT